MSGVSFVRNREAVAASARLSNAVRLEEYFHRLSAEYGQQEVLSQWAASRRLVKKVSKDYAAVLALLSAQ